MEKDMNGKNINKYGLSVESKPGFSVGPSCSTITDLTVKN